MRDGPLHTVVGAHAHGGRVQKSRRGGAAAAFNPFEGMPSYTARYKPEVRALPRFDTRTYGETFLHVLPGLVHTVRASH